MTLRRDPQPLGRVRLQVRRRPLATRTQLEERLTHVEAMLAGIREVMAPLREPDATPDATMRGRFAEAVEAIDDLLGHRP